MQNSLPKNVSISQTDQDQISLSDRGRKWPSGRDRVKHWKFVTGECWSKAKEWKNGHDLSNGQLAHGSEERGANLLLFSTRFPPAELRAKRGRLSRSVIAGWSTCRISKLIKTFHTVCLNSTSVQERADRLSSFKQAFIFIRPRKDSQLNFLVAEDNVACVCDTPCDVVRW